ncbi:hypothetical protein ABFY41_02715 [Acinetobacter haemolyticus]|uniref:hypothetical protein n=1 Tax=Acinetobacter haemolyticus TaxID=29430 RepID=UPI002A6A41D6|nr:hypothetical protein [Acinetobacter haemolyticus]WPO67880.1 hypothetical protein SDC64_02785 [Acinetobacter haemolyticus]
MRLSFSTKIVVVTLLIGVCSTQTNARRLYKWVDQSSVTNYSEFQPREGTTKKLEVLESRGSDYVDPMMAVTAEMKAIEIPVDLITPQDQVTTRPSATLPQSQQPSTQTVVKQGMLAPAYTQPNTTVAVIPMTEKKEIQVAQTIAVIEKKEITINPTLDKVNNAGGIAEKKADLAVSVPAERKPQATINPWTRAPSFVPSNLVPQNLPKTTTSP